jgi:putative addiction module component (TIGR02574 family)
MSQADVAKILALSVEERLNLIALIWESLSNNQSEIPVSDAERALLDERLAEHALDPDDVISHEEVLAMARRPRR